MKKKCCLAGAVLLLFCTGCATSTLKWTPAEAGKKVPQAIQFSGIWKV